MRAPTFSPCSMDIGLDADMPPYGIGIGSGAGIPAICEKGIEMVINNRPTFHAWGHLAVVGTAIGRPSVTVSANYGMVAGAEDRNNLLVERIVLSQIAFCGRAMRAPTVSSSVPSTRHGIGIKKDTGMVIGVRQFYHRQHSADAQCAPLQLVQVYRHAAWHWNKKRYRSGHWRKAILSQTAFCGRAVRTPTFAAMQHSGAGFHCAGWALVCILCTTSYNEFRINNMIISSGAVFFIDFIQQNLYSLMGHLYFWRTYGGKRKG